MNYTARQFLKNENGRRIADIIESAERMNSNPWNDYVSIFELKEEIIKGFGELRYDIVFDNYGHPILLLNNWREACPIVRPKKRRQKKYWNAKMNTEQVNNMYTKEGKDDLLMRMDGNNQVTGNKIYKAYSGVGIVTGFMVFDDGRVYETTTMYIDGLKRIDERFGWKQIMISFMEFCDENDTPIGVALVQDNEFPDQWLDIMDGV